MSLRDDQLATLKAAGKDFDYYNIANLDGIDHLPYSLKVLEIGRASCRERV